jgi:hypothetical protein
VNAAKTFCEGPQKLSSAPLSFLPSPLLPLPFAARELTRRWTTITTGENQDAHTKRQRQNRRSRIFQEDRGKSGPEPKTASLIAIHGNEVSYAWNVLEDLKAAGASYTRRNIIADMFPVWA